MLNLEKIDEDILEELRDRFEDSGNPDERIRRMSPEEAFDEWCEWHGLQDWGPALRTAMRILQRAEVRGG